MSYSFHHVFLWPPSFKKKKQNAPSIDTQQRFFSNDLAKLPKTAKKTIVPNKLIPRAVSTSYVTEGRPIHEWRREDEGDRRDMLHRRRHVKDIQDMCSTPIHQRKTWVNGFGGLEGQRELKCRSVAELVSPSRDSNEEVLTRIEHLGFLHQIPFSSACQPPLSHVPPSSVPEVDFESCISAAGSTGWSSCD